MTDEDLNRRFDQMERLLSAHLEHVDEHLNRVDEHLNRVDERLDRFEQRLEGFAQALVGNLSDLRTEFIERFDRVDRRLERTENSVNAILAQVAGMSKSLTEGERIDTLHEVRLSAQQRAIDELYRRIAELERRNPPAA